MVRVKAVTFAYSRAIRGDQMNWSQRILGLYVTDTDYQREGKPMNDNVKTEIEVVTYTCEKHKHLLFDTIKWHLVDKGLWYPKGLSYGRTCEDRACFCGKLATHIIKYKIPLKVDP